MLLVIFRAPLHCMFSKMVVVYLQFYFYKEFPLTKNGISLFLFKKGRMYHFALHLSCMCVN